LTFILIVVQKIVVPKINDFMGGGISISPDIIVKETLRNTMPRRK
jgi:hypothetical protein